MNDSKIKKMKRIVAISIFSLVIVTAHSQVRHFVDDQEKLFLKEEVAGMDSLLAGYYARTGNHVGVVSIDTLMGPLNDFIQQFVQKMGLDKINDKYGMVLFLSRKQSMINIRVNLNLEKFVSDSLLMTIISAGIPDLKEKRTAKGVMEICRAGMNFMDSVAKKP